MLESVTYDPEVAKAISEHGHNYIRNLTGIKYQNTAIIGKFMPPHYGHVFMVEAARAVSDKVHLMVYTQPSEQMPGKWRYQALAEHYAHDPVVQVHWVHKEMPQHPHEHPDFWNIWKNDLASQIPGKIDCVAGAEEYVKRLAEDQGAYYYLIDPKRTVVECSGTKCREHTTDMWDFVIPEFRQHMVKKICIVGGESVGKSTLVRMLAAAFCTNYMPEYGREYTEKKHASQGRNSEWKVADFEKIASEHRRHLKAACKHSNRVIFCDTDEIVTKCFLELFLGSESYSRYLDNAIQDSHYDLYVLVKPNIPFMQDGTRDFPHIRQEQFDLIQENLNRYHRNYVVLDEPEPIRRVEIIKALVKQLLEK